MSGQDICGWCGVVEDADELKECKIRGRPARVCLRCLAMFAKLAVYQ